MTRRRFMADSVSGDRAALLGAHAAHLSRVLRARVGQEFDLAADGHVRRGRIIAVEDERIEFQLGEEVSAEVLTPLTLYLAIIKFDRMEWAIEKCTELGVASIVPIVCARTDIHLAAAASKRVERWQRLAIQASEQARRSAPPDIAAPAKLNRDLLAVEGMRVVLGESERQLSLKQALAMPETSTQISSGISLAVGPEGGWTESELALFAEMNWVCASLGKTILRAETAAIAAVVIAMSELE